MKNLPSHFFNQPPGIFNIDADSHTGWGTPIWYKQPDKTLIYWDDLVLHLQQRRYAGAFGVSIFNHLVLCSLLAPVLWRIEQETAGKSPVAAIPHSLLQQVAAHDLHEAYVPDLPKGLVAVLPEYSALETIWQAHLHRQLQIPLFLPGSQEAAFIGRVDALAAYAEMAVSGHRAVNLQWERTRFASMFLHFAAADLYRNVCALSEPEKQKQLLASLSVDGLFL